MRSTAFLIFTLYAQLTFGQEKPLVLVNNGRSDWHLVPLDSGASMKAATFIQGVLDSLSGCQLKVSNRKGGRNIFIGVGDTITSRTGAWSSVFGHDEWFVFDAYGDLFVGGPNDEEIDFAARRFVQDLNGLELLTPGRYTYQRQKKVQLIRGPYADYSEPAFNFRMVYYGPATNDEYAAWHHLRQVKKTRDPEDPDRGLWVHTMHRFVPQAQFEQHPEYFAERNGMRVHDQLCLSNPEVLRITVDSLRAMMQRDPYAEYWSVSQMDNFNFCQCAQCHSTDSIEGSPSGSIIRFANAVADSFPDQVISTLAYQYSRTAPQVTKPRRNVNIMLCSIEEDRSRPIATRDEPGPSRQICAHGATSPATSSCGTT